MISSPMLQAMLEDLVKNGVYITCGSGAPSNGASGTGVNICGKGSLYLDFTNGTMYQNTGTITSPTWTQNS